MIKDIINKLSNFPSNSTIEEVVRKLKEEDIENTKTWEESIKKEKQDLQNFFDSIVEHKYYMFYHNGQSKSYIEIIDIDDNHRLTVNEVKLFVSGNSISYSYSEKIRTINLLWFSHYPKRTQDGISNKVSKERFEELKKLCEQIKELHNG